MRSPLALLAGLVAVVLTPVVGHWLVRGHLEAELAEALDRRLEQAGFAALEVEVDNFAATLSGPVEHEGRRVLALGLVDEVFPLYLAPGGDQLTLDARLEPFWLEGRVRFNDSRLSPSQFEALKSWLARIRPDLLPRVDWRTLEVSESVVGEAAIPADGSAPPADSPAGHFWPLLEEPALLVALRTEDTGGFRLMGVLPEESWLESVEAALPGEVAVTRASARVSLRFGEHVRLGGFGRPRQAAVGFVVAGLMADPRTSSVTWNGGEAGSFDWRLRGEPTAEEVALWQEAAARANGLPPHRALRVRSVD